MIQYANKQSNGVFLPYEDVKETLKPNQILLRGTEDDAINACNVLGTSKASWAPVYWRRKAKQLGIYTDYIVTLK